MRDEEMGNQETQLQRMKLVLEISRELASTGSLEKLLHGIVRAAAELIDAETAGILLMRGDELRFVAAGQFADQLFDIPVPIDSSIAGASFSSGEPVIVPDVQQDHRYFAVVEQRIGYKARSLLAVPLQFKERRIGVLEAENKCDDQFTSEDVDILVALAAQAAVAIENTLLVKALRQSRDGLERCVEERTAELSAANVTLQQEITDRKLAEAMLRESEARFRRIIENAPIGYFRVGKDGTWRYVNPEWMRMHGYRFHEVIGKSFEFTQPEETREQAKETVRQALAGESLRGESARLCKDGTVKYHIYSVQPVYHRGEIVAIEGFINDITERVQGEAV